MVRGGACRHCKALGIPVNRAFRGWIGGMEWGLRGQSTLWRNGEIVDCLGIVCCN